MFVVYSVNLYKLDVDRGAMLEVGIRFGASWWHGKIAYGGTVPR